MSNPDRQRYQIMNDMLDTLQSLGHCCDEFPMGDSVRFFEGEIKEELEALQQKLADMFDKYFDGHLEGWDDFRKSFEESLKMLREEIQVFKENYDSSNYPKGTK